MKILKKIILFLLILIIILLLTIAYFIIFHSYSEDRSNINIDKNKIPNFSNPDIDGDGINNIEDIIKNARELKGVYYDYFTGYFNDIGRKVGFLVCIDIVKIAYENAGIYFEPMLREDFKKHREFYNTEKGNNTPATPFFFRRTRNLYAYCEANKKLIKNCKLPKPGDFVFYRKSHIALVVEVHKDSTYNEIENAPWTNFTVEHENKKWIPRDVGRILKD